MLPLLPLILLRPTTGLMPQQSIETRIDRLLSRMTLREKLSQMSQTAIPGEPGARDLKAAEEGRYGSFYGWGTPQARAELQRAARHGRLGIPIVFGDDVIHGYATGFPIPLGQAASFDPDLVQQCARVAAKEATSSGLQWTFSPMMDIARDPRWGRIAEGYGEDPYLASAMAVATVRGYQGRSLNNGDSVAACGKHYVGYGAAEAGRDYNTTWIPENLLRDVYLKPFQACANAGIGSFMSAFNALNGVPASGNPLTLHQILRNEWHWDGMVVSDFDAVNEMIAHGYAADGADAARKAIKAGVDMEMISEDYYTYGPQLVREKKLDLATIDSCVRNILRMKFRLGLFDGRPQSLRPIDPTDATFLLSKKIAQESLVLLKNEGGILPLSSSVGKVAVIGPLADSPENQIGSWSHCDPKTSITPLASLRARLGDNRVLYAPGIQFKWDSKKSDEQNLANELNVKDESGFPQAIEEAEKADFILLFLGEPANVSGEASSRSTIGLPGAEDELVAALAKLGKSMIGVIMAGRPLTLSDAASQLNALLYAWGPGPMGGPAIIDTLFGDNVPSGKLPVTFPRSVGQIPIYYDHLNTGRPVLPGSEDRYTSRYLDIPYSPAYPFGYGLSYTTFSYSPTRVEPVPGGFKASAEVTNTGKVDADEIVQFYTHQMVGSVARPVRELKGFQRVHLKAGETKTVTFLVRREDLAFWNQEIKYVVEPGRFEAWVAPDSISGTAASFEVK